jgi:hypothetical protein
MLTQASQLLEKQAHHTQPHKNELKQPKALSRDKQYSPPAQKSHLGNEFSQKTRSGFTSWLKRARKSSLTMNCSLPKARRSVFVPSYVSFAPLAAEFRR